jgi:hypothetical protein
MLALPTAALAQAPGEISPDPSVNQYVESVPTSKGSRPSTGGGAKGAKLPPAVQRRIEEQAGADAADLSAIATDPDAGAPAASRDRPRDRAAGSRDRRPVPQVEEKAPLAAAAEATFDAGGGGLVLLLFGLLGTTILVGGFAVSRRRGGGL